MLPEAVMRRAFYARDASFDGRFVTGVRTTGIYCRPTCAARKPRPENVRFFADSSDARAAGFRACLRCKPDEAREIAARVGEIARADPAFARAASLARRLGLSPRAVARRFHAETGEPLARFLRRRRLLAAADALRAGASVADAARLAGFASRSGFHAAFRRLKGASPGAWRMRA